MSNPEKRPEGMGDFPPPPPGPPPYQEHAAYEPGQQHAPLEQPPYQPAQSQQYQPEQSQQYPPEKQSAQDPPHPNPLSANPVHSAQQPPPPISAQQPLGEQAPPQPPTQQPLGEQPSAQTSAEGYHIPAYNPANPVFAPPPTGEATETAEPHTGQHTGQHTAQPTAQPAVQQPATQPAAGHSEPVAASTTTTDAAQKKPGWSERFAQFGIKAAAPINSIAHKLGSQSFLPETLDKECDKAAVTLKTFCKKGVYADPSANQPPTSTDPKATETTGEGIIDPTKEKPKSRVLVTIPPKVISKAVGLAIFTTLRAGFQITGATGSGILIARLPDGSWSPPSGIQVHSVGGGFSIGLDIYDCVCVINSREALAAFMNMRVSLGSDLAVVAGPYGAGGAVELGASMDKSKGDKKPGEAATTPAQPAASAEDKQTLKPEKDKNHRRSLSASATKPVFSYVKSRGFYAGIQVDGTVVVERKDANAAFYGERVPVERILKGEVPAQGPSGMWPTGARALLEVLKGAEAGVLQDGRDASSSAPATGPAAAGSQGLAGSEAAPGVSTGGPPAYVDDGVQRAGVGDHKYM